MSADKYNYWADRLNHVDIDSLLEQPYADRRDISRDLADSLLFGTYKKKHGTLGVLIDELREMERYL